MFGLKWSLIGWGLLAVVLLVTGSAGAGYIKGKQDKTAEVERLAAIDFAARVDKAFEIADAFIEIGKNVAGAMSSRVATGAKIAKVGAQHVKEHPEIRDTGILDEQLMELRRCSIDEVWRAYGHPLPSFRAGATCPSGVSDQQPGGGSGS